MRHFLPLCLVLLLSLTASSPAAEMAWPQDLPAPTQQWLEKALKAAADHPQVPYKLGAATPQEGMDCSGAVTYLLGLAGVTPPRSSAAMHTWLAKTPTFVTVPAGANDISHAIYQKLRPGDLIFWAKQDGSVSHVHLFLGREKSDGRWVMIGSSEGRSYRGVKRSGFGIVDFRVPRPGSPTRIIGFGPPPLKQSITENDKQTERGL
jgi:peptidoglycan DL-endopeptidase CwlO